MRETVKEIDGGRAEEHTEERSETHTDARPPKPLIHDGPKPPEWMRHIVNTSPDPPTPDPEQGRATEFALGEKHRLGWEFGKAKMKDIARTDFERNR